MGSRRLPGKEALAPLLALLAAGLAAGACRPGEAQVAASPTASTAATATATFAPPTPPPDPLGEPPRDAAEAATKLAPFLADTGTGCAGAATLRAAWNATCAAGDLDGDGRADVAVLVPLPATGRTPNPGVVLVQRSGRASIDQFPPAGEADASIVGRGIFTVAERTGDGKADVVLLANACGGSACASRVYVEAWDGTAWRDLGPGEAVDSLDGIVFEGTGPKGKLVMHGGIINAAGAGPQRGEARVYEFNGARWVLIAILPDAPAYLFHAVEDADGLFDRGKFEEAAAAYKAAIESKELKDWRTETGAAAGRDDLVAYALLRIAVATAARGQDPAKTIDAIIRDVRQELFVNAAMAFRKGMQDGGGVHGGCLEVAQYLGTPGIPEIIHAMFDYGFANYPAKGYRDICPL